MNGSMSNLKSQIATSSWGGRRTKTNAAVYHIVTSCIEGSHGQIELPEPDRASIRAGEYLTELPPGELHDRKLHAAIRLAREQLERRGDGEAITRKLEVLGYGP